MSTLCHVMSCDCRVSADDIERHFLWSCDLLLEVAFRIHLILTRIRILGSTFGKSGSGSSEPPFRNSGSGSLDPHLEKVDPGRTSIFLYGDSRPKSDVIIFFII